MTETELADLVHRLRSLNSCAVSDALDRLGLVPAITGLTRLSGDGRIAGRVRTVTLVEGKAPGGAARHLCTTAVASSGPLDVIVIENASGLDAAGWGGVLSAAARIRGIQGAIVEGPARDLDEARSLGFPVFARSATAHTARGRIYETATDATIHVGDATVAAGDLVLADGSAVAFVPIDRAVEVIATAEHIAAAEAQMVALLRAGKPVTEVMGRNYETMLEK